jgi:hypothetical protein
MITYLALRFINCKRDVRPHSDIVEIERSSVDAKLTPQSDHTCSFRNIPCQRRSALRLQSMALVYIRYIVVAKRIHVPVSNLRP